MAYVIDKINFQPPIDIDIWRIVNAVVNKRDYMLRGKLRRWQRMNQIRVKTTAVIPKHIMDMLYQIEQVTRERARKFAYKAH